jgi:hypothetical protein
LFFASFICFITVTYFNDFKLFYNSFVSYLRTKHGEKPINSYIRNVSLIVFYKGDLIATNKFDANAAADREVKRISI